MICPEGHETRASDFCDVCGSALDAPDAPDAPPTLQATPVTQAAEQRCAACGEPRSGRFCEECGHDAAAPVPASAAATSAAAPPEPTTWTALVCADQAWFDEVRARNGPDAALLDFPPYCPDRRFVLDGERLTIGRRSRSRGVEPEIDLTGPPLDPGVSTVHAMLLRGGSGDTGWQIVDLGSTNGTSVGEGTPLLAAHTPHPLSAGERVKLGAWTTITLVRG